MGDLYNKKISILSSHFDKNKSLTEILESFSCLSKDFDNELKIDKLNYSSYDYNECSKEEQNDFYNDQLQMIETLVASKIYDKAGTVWNWKAIFDLMHNPSYALVDKINRKVVYSTALNQRPIGDKAYNMWNGLQIIDLDIKNEEISKQLKPLLFDELKKYHWFLGLCTSASKKSLHVWTKITPISINFDKRKIEYLCNFRQKYSYIYLVLNKYKNQLGYTKESIFRFMDMAMAKPQQGIFISHDTDAKLSMNFKDERLDVGFESAYSNGIESIDWISHPDLKDIFAKLEWFNNDTFVPKVNVDISNIDNINEKKLNGTRKHYKHAHRWQLANTLTSLYGEDKALQYLVQICSGTDKRELAGDVKTAALHEKPISIWAIKELNKFHGFKIKIKGTEEDKENKQSNILTNGVSQTRDDIDPISVLNPNTNKVVLHLNRNQYLSDIKDDILKNLSHITLLEAGAGYGKTEMVKAFKAKTMMLLPYTSIIKSKFERDEKASDWLYYFGNKRATDDEIMGASSITMTLDKFSRLNVMEIDHAGFEYIVLDESHLLFISSFRDVMAPVIQRLANCKSKIILMTGTPTGETLFFPNIKHIKVIKEDVREKKLDIYFCSQQTEQYYEMCKMMAKDIMEGKKILYPTNAGNLHYEWVRGVVNKILIDSGFERECNSFYYKKSNYGDKSMDKINYGKSIGDNDIIFGSTYLSVGVDICDDYTFSIYFSELEMAQTIEQYANRIRNNDLFIKMFLPKFDSEGYPINYTNIHRLDLTIDRNAIIMARDLINTCNDAIERNNEEAKYNPLIGSIITVNKYIKYDENECKYFIDETTYKLNVFEEKYGNYAKQLEIIKNGMKHYGYIITFQDIDNYIPEQNLADVEAMLKMCRTIRNNQMTTQTFKFLNHITDANIDVYKEILNGNYDLFKSNSHLELSGENQLYTESLEILEKNTPIIVSLYRWYDIPTIIKIYKYCTGFKSNKINYTALNKIRKFAILLDSLNRHKLDFPIKKFVKDSRDWVNNNPSVSQKDIDIFIANWTASYCNSIKDLVVDDLDYFKSMNNHIDDLFNIIINRSRPKGGVIKLTPMKLLWETRKDLENIYGNETTRLFFIDELIDDVKDDELKKLDSSDIEDFIKTKKLTLEDIKPEIPNIIHKPFEYDVYSKLDGSNERFMRKQENTNPLRDNIFDNNEVIQEEDKKVENKDLFSDLDNYEENLY